MKSKVLIVDDDTELLEILKEQLSLRGFEVAVAQNGEEFQAQVLQEKPHVIILDIMLGDENGVHIYEHLVDKGFDAKVPVIFLSGLASDRPSSPGGPGRTFALLGKPIRIDTLVAEIERLGQA
jgi:DNA-binding response OmpR family regulator